MTQPNGGETKLNSVTDPDNVLFEVVEDGLTPTEVAYALNADPAEYRDRKGGEE